MAEKVWVIQDPTEKTRTKKTVTDRLPPDTKDPGAAYSLSILLWGSGQFYADRIIKGLAFIFVMLFIIVGTAVAVFNRDSLLSLLRSRRIAFADAFLAAEILLFVVLAFWAYNASDAYHAAAAERRRRFAGVKNRVFPALCSLVFPGWGQYLNGQPVKGGIFAAFSVICWFALFSAAFTLLAWPGLEVSSSRDFIEEVFAASVIVAAAAPIVWILGCYDALMISLDEYKKEPFFERLKAMNNRRRTQGWVRGVFPRISSVFALTGALVVIIVVAHWALPERYYLSLLDSAGTSLRRQGMSIVPEIVRTVLERLSPH